MAYTPFIKSYGDFEVVVPAVDFSCLTRDQATEIVKALRTYVQEGSTSYVCHWLCSWTLGGYYARECIEQSHPKMKGQGLAAVVAEGHPWLAFTLWENNWYPGNPCGNELRRAWCRHMANEIEREFGL